MKTKKIGHGGTRVQNLSMYIRHCFHQKCNREKPKVTKSMLLMTKSFYIFSRQTLILSHLRAGRRYRKWLDMTAQEVTWSERTPDDR